MNGAYIRVCRTVLIQVKRNRFTGALLVPSVTADQPVYGAGLVAAALVDLQQRSFPAWFRGLLFLLTFFAVISRRRTSTCDTRTIRTWPVPSNKCTKMRPHRQPRGRPGWRRQQRRRRGAQPAALAHRPPRHDPQQPLHAQVSKYSVQPIFIIIHLNLCRLGSNWHLEASLKSVCGMNFCNLLQHQPKTRRLWTLWTIFIVNFMTIFMYIDI